MPHQKPLRERLTPDLLERLRTRQMTNKEAAALLNVNASYLSFVFNQLDSRNPGEVSVNRLWLKKLMAARRDVKLREAKFVIDGHKSLQQAAKKARCSERTMRRYIEVLKDQEAEK